jgi:hypothetical protein
MFGIIIENLVLNDLQILNNEIDRNDSGGIYISQVHQKSNKNKFILKNTSITENCNGCGLILKDSGISIERCKIDRNNDDGILIQGNPKPTRIL